MEHAKAPTILHPWKFVPGFELIAGANRIVLLAKLIFLIAAVGWTAWYMHAVWLVASLFNLSLRSYTVLDWMKLAAFGVGPIAIAILLFIAKWPTNKGGGSRQR